MSSSSNWCGQNLGIWLPARLPPILGGNCSQGLVPEGPSGPSRSLANQTALWANLPAGRLRCPTWGGALDRQAERISADCPVHVLCHLLAVGSWAVHFMSEPLSPDPQLGDGGTSACPGGLCWACTWPSDAGECLSNGDASSGPVPALLARAEGPEALSSPTSTSGLLGPAAQRHLRAFQGHTLPGSVRTLRALLLFLSHCKAKQGNVCVPAQGGVREGKGLHTVLRVSLPGSFQHRDSEPGPRNQSVRVPAPSVVCGASTARGPAGDALSGRPAEEGSLASPAGAPP